MPVVTQPDIIEVSDFRGGWSPDGENDTTEPDVLLDVMNLLPDPNTGSLLTRKGFERLHASPIINNSTNHYVRQVYNFNSAGEGHYLIAILTNGAAAANNVRLYAASLADMTWQRIDDGGVTWSRPNGHHWGVAVDGVWYGGSRGNDMYSWDPTTWNTGTSNNGTWDAQAGTGNWRTWVNDTDAGVDTDTEYAKDFAWTGKERVTLSGDTYQPAKNIRYDDWDEDVNRYIKGDLVSVRDTWATSPDVTYWKSFKCTEDHHPDTSSNKPGSGSSWEDVWKKVVLPKPFNSDSETSDKWMFVPIAAKTSVATWHSNRLFMRYDDQGDKSRVLYSAPIKPEKGADVPDTVWRPTDFAPSTQFDGAGGGWMPFSDGKHGGIIEALHSYNQYLVVFKRAATYVLSGTDDGTWNVRNLGHPGIVGPQAKHEMDGLLYFLADDGLYVTDGTSIEPALNHEKAAEWLRLRIDGIKDNDQDLDAQMWAYNDILFISVPDSEADEPGLTIAYEPKTGSWWKLDLPVTDACTYREEGRTHVALCVGTEYSDESIVYEYTGDDDDDGGATAGAPNDIYWYLKTAWWPFGTRREERRIRRVWAIVRHPFAYTIELYRNYDSTSWETQVNDTTTGTLSQYIEGAVANTNAYAIQFFLDGLSAPASVHGIAVDTEPRRSRFHQ